MNVERIQRLEAALNAIRETTTQEIEPEIEAVYAACAVPFTLCAECGTVVPLATAHLHQGVYIGDLCCWTEQLRSSE